MVDNIFDFTGIDVKIADEVYEAFNEVFKKFPNLKKAINNLRFSGKISVMPHNLR